MTTDPKHLTQDGRIVRVHQAYRVEGLPGLWVAYALEETSVRLRDPLTRQETRVRPGLLTSLPEYV